MSIDETRAGVLQAEINSGFSGVLFMEILVLSLAGGLYYLSWWVFGGLLFGLTIALFIYPLNLIMLVLMIAGWTVVLAGLGYGIGEIPASIIFGVVGFVVSCGVHIASMGALTDQMQ